MAQTFGTSTDASQYLEIPDPANAGQVIRPAAGLTINVRDAVTLADLGNQTSQLYGYFNFVLDDGHPIVQVSADGGTTWVTLISLETRIAVAQSFASVGALSGQIADLTTALGNVTGSIGAPGGLATLDANGHVDAAQVVGIVPVRQNADGSWPADPGGTNAVEVLRVVAGSSAPTWVSEARGDYMTDEALDFAG
jgi:hypothetical protein